MIFESHILQEPLTKYIQAIFHFKGFMPDHSIERVVPTGHLFILFELDDIARHTFDNETLKANGTYKKVWVSGIHKNYISISAPQNSEMFVIQFRPTGAFPFFNSPINELNDKVINAEEIFGEKILELRDELVHASSSKDKFLFAENWLHQRYLKEVYASDELITIFNKITAQPISDYKEAIQTYSKTQKHLIDQFKKHFGLTPKNFQRIFRFNEILQQIQHKKHVKWSEIAYNCGYADQSHFIKEFKEFSGFNPVEFISKDFNKDEPNFFPLD